MKPQVLIIGAGPTGLTLALWLTRSSVPVRIIDKSDGPGETSRALAVQARTLEFHRQLGTIDDVLAAGVKIEHIAIHTPDGIAARPDLSAFGRGLSRFSYAFALPQDIHERILIHHLERAGVHVERRTELVSFKQYEHSVTATLSRDGAMESCDVAYLCGSDGAHSPVRHALGIGFPGGAYQQKFYVADVVGDGDITKGGMDVSLSAYGFAVIMPVRQSGSVRVIGIVPKDHEGDEEIRFEDIRDTIERDSGVTIQSVNWFSVYRVHHRVAEKFRVGRAFLLGDAGHVHSPAGGQGMNTGMGDAVNLAWKLAAVLQRRASENILDTYESERIAFAHLLIKTTDQAFKFLTSRSPVSRFMRRRILPAFMGAMLKTKAGAHVFFRTVSQIAIQYRPSALSRGRAGEVHGGDRLPYVADGQRDNFAPLASLDWQVHVYGKASEPFVKAISMRGVPVHRFAWSNVAAKAGLKRNAAYLIRPDGYIALATPTQNIQSFASYLRRLSLKARSVAHAPPTELPNMAFAP
jgi:2-polyprenyl-6-methoxyphenol hydroxylase-like FAD-dependent oxidoreductase